MKIEEDNEDLEESKNRSEKIIQFQENSMMNRIIMRKAKPAMAAHCRRSVESLIRLL
jgi:malate synthase